MRIGKDANLQGDFVVVVRHRPAPNLKLFLRGIVTHTTSRFTGA